MRCYLNTQTAQSLALRDATSVQRRSLDDGPLLALFAAVLVSNRRFLLGI
jgi:hypothetical protein